MAAKMAGVELVGRVVALEAFLIVLMEAYIDRPDVDLDKGKALLGSMLESAKRLAAQLGHSEAQRETEAYAEQLVKILVANLPAMHGEFGKPAAPAA